MKRKADSDEENLEECNLSKELLNQENVTENDNAINCEKECSNSLDQQKSDNGGSSERAGTSDDKSKDESKSSEDQISEQSDRKLTVSNHVLLFTEDI